MRIIKDKQADGTIVGYMLRLSACETGMWARRPHASWPCSTLKDRRLWVAVDRNGLYDYAVNGGQFNSIDDTELDACVSDHLPADCRHLWPVWGK